MNTRRPGFALRDLIALGVMAFVLVAIATSTLGHPCGTNRRQICANNLKGIGTSAKIYANDNSEKWMVPPFRQQAIANEGIDYLAGNHVSQHPTDPGEVGYDRETQTVSETRDDAGSEAVSVTRSFWILVRSGDVVPDQFICPSSGDDAEALDRVPGDYYDFASYHNISYGYQVPFGPRDTQPREGADNRQAFAADKGPFYLNKFEPKFLSGHRNRVDFGDPHGRWRRYNSPNHNGHGQNVLFADAHVAFAYTPAVGIHGDNIYTLMTSEWDPDGFNLIHGESPHFATVAAYPYPGQGAFGDGPNLFSSTDSLIYP